MADEEHVEEPENNTPSQEAETPAATPAAKPPEYVSVEAFNAFKDQLISELRTPRQPAAAAAPTATTTLPAIDEPTEDEIAAAYESGDARQIARIQKRQAKASEERTKRHFDSQIAQVREVGLGAIAGMARSMGTKELKFYKRYQREIDEAVETIAPDQRLSPEVYKAAHDIVVGRHIDEIIAEQATTAARAEEQSRTQTPGKKTGRAVAAERAEAEKVPSAKELGGQSFLDYTGKDQDQFAQGLGYKDWADYVGGPDETPARRAKREAAEAAQATKH